MVDFMYMWKEVEHSIPLGMIFKKMYCHKCGERLVKNKYSRIILKGDPEYKIYKRGYFGEGKAIQHKYNYRCPMCGNIIEYKKQVMIAKIQKKNKNKIVNIENEMIEKQS